MGAIGKLWYYDQYIEKQKSTTDIAIILGVNHQIVNRRLRQFDIPLRSRKEATQTLKSRTKVSKVHKGKVCSEEHKLKVSEAKKKLWSNGPFKKKMSIINKSLWENDDYRKKTLEAKQKAGISEEGRLKLSESKIGSNNPSWKGGISYEPYCIKFNYSLKEKIRNRDERICALCGKSEIENGRRLSIHHIDGDKMQGCNGNRWHLCSLCISCNVGEQHNRELYEFLIISNNQWRWML